MKLDFKIQKDDFGYFVVAYRLVDGVELQYPTLKTMSILLNFLEDDLKNFFIIELGSDDKPKNNIMHFTEYSQAMKAVDKFRDMIPKGFATNNIYLTR